MPEILYNLTTRQKQYLNDFAHRFYVIPPGRRSRKTLISMRKVMYAAMMCPETRYFHAAPTRKQAKEIFWEKLKKNTRDIWARQPSETDLKVFLVNGSTIQIEGLDKPERIEGSEWDGGHITETGNTKPNFWTEHLRPCFSDTARIENGLQLGFCIFDGVPEGRNHYYKMALRACNGVLPETKPMVGAFASADEWAYYHWFAEDVLNKHEIEQARNDMDERTFKQEYEGSFESYEGLLYYSFSRRNINDEVTKYSPNEPLYLSCDFNNSPMVWLVGQKSGDVGKYIDEIVITHNAKTKANLYQFLDRYKRHQNKILYLTGDSSGNFEDHRDHSTDYVIIAKGLRGYDWKIMNRVPNSNPSINNRVNIGCSLFESIGKKSKVFINSRCTYLIDDLEQNESDGKGGKDKSDPMRTHASDCFDYQNILWYSEDFFKTRIVQI